VGGEGKLDEIAIKAIPYYAWANRGIAWMEVWLAHDATILPKPKPPTVASTSRVSASFWNKGQSNLGPEAVNDQEVPANSDDRSVLWFHWWPHRGGMEWIHILADHFLVQKSEGGWREYDGQEYDDRVAC